MRFAVDLACNLFVAHHSAANYSVVLVTGSAREDLFHVVEKLAYSTFSGLDLVMMVRPVMGIVRSVSVRGNGNLFLLI